MGRGFEYVGDVLQRIVMDAVDGPVVAPWGERLYPLLADRYGCSYDYVRQCINELEDYGTIFVVREGIEVVAYDLHPLHLARTSTQWSPTQMLRALVEAADCSGALSRARYEAFPGSARPPAALIVETFRGWDCAVAAAGLTTG